MLEVNEQFFKFTVSNLAQKAQFCKCSGNMQCRDGHNEDDLADFGPITRMFKFIMATSRHDCAIIYQKIVGIRPNSAISVRLFLLCHGGFWEMRAELNKDSKFKRLPKVMITVPWLLHKLMWYFISLKTNILALLLMQKMLKFYIFTMC